METENYGFHFKLDKDKSITVTNNTSERFVIYFSDPIKKYNGYYNTDFNSNAWVKTNPLHWETTPESDIIQIILRGKNIQYSTDVSLKEMKIYKTVDTRLKIKDYEFDFTNISFLVPVFNTKEYFDECVTSIINACDKDINYEIIVGIDNDYDFIRHILDNEYGENVKFYFFEENMGLSYVKNTLAHLSKYNNILFIDSDDVCTKELVNEYKHHINDYDIIRWKAISFKDGENYIKKTEIHSADLGGCFGIKKEIFLKENGFHPWRCQSDDEFMIRTKDSYNTKKINKGLFYYRRHNKSLSNNPKTNSASKLRKTYVNYLENHIANNTLKKPDRFYICDNIIRIK